MVANPDKIDIRQVNKYRDEAHDRGYELDALFEEIELSTGSVLTVKDKLIGYLAVCKVKIELIRKEYCKITGSSMTIKSFEQTASRNLNNRLKEYVNQSSKSSSIILKKTPLEDYRKIIEEIDFANGKKSPEFIFHTISETEAIYIVNNPDKLSKEQLLDFIRNKYQ